MSEYNIEDKVTGSKGLAEYYFNEIILKATYYQIILLQGENSLYCKEGREDYDIYANLNN